MENIRFVDEQIGLFYEKFEHFFENDGRTAYVFSSDRGMSAKGSRGDGHPDNTQTPFVAWGAGIRKPARCTGDLSCGHSLGLPSLHQSDILQADAAPLIVPLMQII